MKKLFLITILVSLAWGQSCPYDGSGLSYRTGNIKQPRDGYISYEWICEGNAVRGNRHTNWSEEKIQSPTGADNIYQQQPQQQQTQQRSSITAKQVQALYPDFSVKRTEKQNTVDSATRLRLELAKMTPKQRAAYFELEQQEEQRKLNEIAKRERERELEKKLQAERSRKLRQENPLFYWAREMLAVAIIYYSAVWVIGLF